MKPSDENNIVIAEEIDLGEGIIKITGYIKGETEKALLININNGTEKFKQILELCEAWNYLIAINELKILIQYLESKK